MSAQLEDTIALPTAPDFRVLLVATAAALGTSILFGLFPALHASRADVRGTLTDAGTAIAGPVRRWPTRILVTSQVALGIVLVIGAGVLIRSFNRMVTLNSGVDATNVTTATMSLQDARYRTAARVNGLFAQSLDRVARLPGVEHAAIALTLPYERALNNGWRFDEDGGLPSEAISLTYVTPDYFRVLGIPLLQGRPFDGRDTATSPQVVAVNDAFIRRYAADRAVLGRRLRLGGPSPAQIVGVVGAIQQVDNVGNLGPVAAVPAAYIPASQVPDGLFVLVHTWFQPSWIVRTRGRLAIVPSLKRVLHDIDPQLTFNKFRTIDDIRAEATATPRLLASLLAALAAIALTLCVVGVYGLVANSVVERRRELGVRMALGATSLDTLKTAAAASVGLIFCGTLAGLLLSMLVSRVMRQIVFGIAVNDPLTMAAAAGIVALAGTAAAVVPALRTLRMDLTSVLNNR